MKPPPPNLWLIGVRCCLVCKFFIYSHPYDCEKYDISDHSGIQKFHKTEEFVCDDFTERKEI